MTYYPLSISCPECNTTCRWRGVAYSITGELNFTVFCQGCQRERYLKVLDTTLRDWAAKMEHKQTTADTEFLHDLRVSWEESEQLTEPPK